MGLERAHAEFLSQGEGLVVAGYGGLALWVIAPGRNVAQEAQGICLMAASLILTGEHQGTLSTGVRLLQVALQHMRLAQRETTERFDVRSSLRPALLPCPRQEWYGIGETSVQGVRRP